MKHIGDEPKIEIFLDNFKFPDDLKIVLSNGNFKQMIKNKRINIKEISIQTSINTKTIYHYLNSKRNPTLLFIKKIFNDKKVVEILKANRVKFGHGGNAASAVFPAYLTPKLAYLVGALRDGHIYMNGKYELCYTQKNVLWLKLINSLILEVFFPSNNPRIIIRENNTPKLTINNKPICEFLKIVFNIPISDKSNWKTPELILNSPKEIQKYYIRGYFDADGISGKHFGFCQVNLQSLKDIRSMLNKFNIKCTNTISKRKLKSGKMFYSLYIQKKFWDDFFNKIGSSNNSKFTRFVQS